MILTFCPVLLSAIDIVNSVRLRVDEICGRFDDEKAISISKPQTFKYMWRDTEIQPSRTIPPVRTVRVDYEFRIK